MVGEGEFCKASKPLMGAIPAWVSQSVGGQQLMRFRLQDGGFER